MKNLLFLLFLATLASCTKIIDIPGAQQQDAKALVVNAVIHPDTNLVVYVSRNYSIIGKTPAVSDLIVRNAQVEVYEDGALFATLPFQDSAAYDPTSSMYGPGKLGYYGPDDKRPTAGKTYTVKVSHPDYPAATATTVVPVAPEIKGASVRFNAIIDADQQELSQVTVKVGDIAANAPYIAVAVGGYTVSPGPSGEYPLLNWLMPAYNQNPGGSLAHYSAFGGINNEYEYGTTYLVYPSSAVKQGELSFYVYNYTSFEDTTKTTSYDSVVVSLAGCDKPYADYIIRLQAHIDSQDPGVAFFQGEKLPMLSNIEGGYGIWGAYAIRRLVVK